MAPRAPLAALVDVGHGDAEVPEAALDALAVLRARRVAVPRVVELPRLLLAAVVPGELDARRAAEAPLRAFRRVRGDQRLVAVPVA